MTTGFNFDFTPLERLKRARIQLLKKHPFYGFLALRLRFIIDNKMDPPTSKVDFRGSMFYDEKFIEKQSDDELQWTVAHEVMHMALLHHTRFFGKRDSLRWTCWNFAGDIIINDILKQSQLGEPKDTPNSDREGLKKFKGKITEAIYEELVKNSKLIEIWGGGCDSLIPTSGDGKEDSGGGSGDIKRGVRGVGGIVGGMGEKDKDKSGKPETSGLSEEEIKKLSEEWKKAVIQAANTARKQGKLPAYIENLIDFWLQPEKVKWKELLFRHIQQIIPKDYTWMKPSKKAMAAGYYLPGYKKENIDIVIGLDVSGSIGDDEYVSFLSEMKYISNCFSSFRFYVISSDCEVKDAFESVDIDEILEHLKKRKGYGGTSFVPIFKWIEDEKPNSKILIYFTDGYGDFPKRNEYGWQTIWVYTGDNKEEPPFGLWIPMEDS